MSKNILEKITYVYAAGVIVLAGWFWVRQIESVRALLEIAYG